jgi:hypothetical protein
MAGVSAALNEAGLKWEGSNLSEMGEHSGSQELDCGGD